MSDDDHDLCGSFCECGPEVTPMTDTERAEYQAETARLRAANVARVQLDAANLRAYDKVTRDAMQALRDTDHAAAIVTDRERDQDRFMVIGSDPTTPGYVADTAFMLAASSVIGWVNRTAEIIGHDHGAALVEDLKFVRHA